jgi:hypothetical protein
MPFPANAIPGQPSIGRKRQKEKRLAEQDFSNLPDWMFWNKTQMDAYIDDNINNLAEAKVVLKALGHFVRIVIRYLEKYEERV